MKKNFLLAFSVIALVAMGVFYACKEKFKPQEVSTTQPAITANQMPADSLAVSAPALLKKNAAVASNQNTYTNAKAGIRFTYPATWVKAEEETNVTNLSGLITETDIWLADSSGETTLLIAHHFAPAGAELYRYAASQFSARKGWYATGGLQLQVAGLTAYQATNTLKTDGRGQKMSSPIVSIVVDVPDKEQTGEFQFQFKTPANGANAQVALFNQLLTGFNFK